MYLVHSRGCLSARCLWQGVKEKAEEIVPVVPTPDAGEPDDDAQNVEELILGESASARGDVLKDEDGEFSLTKFFSFTLTKKTSLQVRKSLANGNCGSPSGSFVILKGEEEIADTYFDSAKEYHGVPTEIFTPELEPGTYLFVVHVTLEQECKNMMFYYDFFLEEAK